MIPADEDFDGTWPYMPHFFDGGGFRMHYIDEGLGDPIVLLHGEPTWGYLYRHFIPRLVAHGRVVVPDHMGFGKSETPQDRTYSTREHVDNLERLLDHLELTDITFVGQDWGGPIASGFALRHPHRIKRLCYMNTGVPGVPPAGTKTVQDLPWFAWVQTPESEAVISNLGGSILSTVRRTARSPQTWAWVRSARRGRTGRS